MCEERPRPNYPPPPDPPPLLIVSWAIKYFHTFALLQFPYVLTQFPPRRVFRTLNLIYSFIQATGGSGWGDWGTGPERLQPPGPLCGTNKPGHFRIRNQQMHEIWQMV